MSELLFWVGLASIVYPASILYEMAEIPAAKKSTYIGLYSISIVFALALIAYPLISWYFKQKTIQHPKYYTGVISVYLLYNIAIAIASYKYFITDDRIGAKTDTGNILKANTYVKLRKSFRGQIVLYILLLIALPFIIKMFKPSKYDKLYSKYVN